MNAIQIAAPGIRVFSQPLRCRWTIALGALAALLAGEMRLAAQTTQPSLSDVSPPIGSGIATDKPPSPTPMDIPPSPPPPTPDHGQLPVWEADPGVVANMGCPPSWRSRVEAVYLNRTGEDGISLSTAFSLNEFGYQPGGRITLDRKYDCVFGWEIIYSGWYEWEEGNTAVGPGTLQTTLIAGPGVSVSAFDDSDFHQQRYQSTLQNVEINQKWWGWDVMSTTAGFRYVNVRENYFFQSTDPNGDTGLFSITTNNHLIGGQLGLDLFQPLGVLSLDSTIKGGLFANVGDSNTGMTNAGVLEFNNAASDVEFAAVVEVGVFARCALTPRLSVRVGYEMLWLYGLGIAVEQVANPITAATGTNFVGDGDTLYHGGSLGAEFVW